MRKKVKPRRGPYLIHLELLREQVESFEQFPHNLPAFRELELLPFHPKVTFLVGENGTGKSTLLEAIAVSVGLNPEGGSRNFNFATRESHSALDKTIRIAKTVSLARDSYFLRAESFYNVASEVDRRGLHFHRDGQPPVYGDRSLHEQSHGESFFALFQYRLCGHGLYLMDEPESALSPSKQLQFLATLHEFCKQGAQFIIATHSPIILAYPNARIYVLNSEGIRETPYEKTNHFLVTRGFLANPKRTLDELFTGDEQEPDIQ